MLWSSSEVPHEGHSNETPQHMFIDYEKKIKIVLPKFLTNLEPRSLLGTVAIPLTHNGTVQKEKICRWQHDTGR